MNTRKPMASKRNLFEKAIMHPYYSVVKYGAITAIAAASLLYPRGCTEHQPVIPMITQQEQPMQEEKQPSPLEKFLSRLEELAQNQEFIAQASLHAPPHDSFDRAFRRVSRYNPFIRQASEDYNIPENLIAAMTIVESEGNPRAVSPAGARGLLQLMPETARQYGIRPHELFDPELNLRTGAAHVLALAKRFEDPIPALRGYNRGPGNLESLTAKNKLPRETQSYPFKVLAVYKKLQSRSAELAAYTK